MTVSVGNGRSSIWIADGTNRAWAFPFKALSASHILLEVTNTDGLASQITSGFNVAGLGNAAGGTVTYPIAPTSPLPAGTKVQIVRRVPLEQPNRIGNQGGFHAQTHEDTFDLVVMQVQQVQDDAIKREAGILEEVDDRFAGHSIIVSGTAEYGSRTVALLASIPTSVSFLRTAGYATAGDGGASLYRRVTAPGTPKAWHFQSADGAWWELAEPEPNSAMFGTKAGSADDATARIQAMIDYVALKGGGDCYIPAGTYRIYGVLTPKQGVRIHGAGMGITTLKHYGTYAHVFGKYTTDLIQDVEITDMTLDMSGLAANNGGIVVEYVERFAVRRCWFVACPVWGISVGVSAAATDKFYRNRKITIEDCVFYDFSVTFEQILLFNSEDVLVQNCHFADTPDGIGVGLYQHTDRVTVRDCRFARCSRGIYYSVTTRNTLIDGCSFSGGVSGIQGANESDHGLFGEVFAYGLKVSGCHFTGCTVGLQLGAVRGAAVERCTFEFIRENAIYISKGNLFANVSPAPSAISITDCIFRNNNTANTFHNLHPGILIVGPVSKLKIAGCHFYDEQAVKTQYYTVVFNEGASADVTIVGCLMTAYETGASVALVGGATVTNCKLYGCWDVRTPLPAGVTQV